MDDAKFQALRQKTREEWLRGESTVPELARKYGIKPDQLYRWRDHDRWDELEARIQTETDRKIQHRLANAISKLREDDFKLWELFRVSIARWFQHWNEKKDDKGNTVPVSLGALDTASKILERVQKGRRLALGVDNADGSNPQGTVSRVEVRYESLNHAIEEAERRVAENRGLPPPGAAPGNGNGNGGGHGGLLESAKGINRVIDVPYEEKEAEEEDKEEE